LVFCPWKGLVCERIFIRDPYRLPEPGFVGLKDYGMGKFTIRKAHNTAPYP